MSIVICKRSNVVIVQETTVIGKTLGTFGNILIRCSKENISECHIQFIVFTCVMERVYDSTHIFIRIDMESRKHDWLFVLYIQVA